MFQNINYERFLYCIKWTQASYRNTTRRLTTNANSGLPDRCLLRYDSGTVQAACATELRVNCIKSSDMCASIKTDLDNVGLLDGEGR